MEVALILKTLGVLFPLIAVPLFTTWRHDPVEGVYVRAFCVLMVITGIYLYLEGIRIQITCAPGTKLDS